jgi:hypothetical protein
MNHYVSLSLTNGWSSVHLYALYSPRTALRTFTPRRDQLVICGQYSCLQVTGYQYTNTFVVYFVFVYNSQSHY